MFGAGAGVALSVSSPRHPRVPPSSKRGPDRQPRIPPSSKRGPVDEVCIDGRVVGSAVSAGESESSTGHLGGGGGLGRLVSGAKRLRTTCGNGSCICCKGRGELEEQLYHYELLLGSRRERELALEVSLKGHQDTNLSLMGQLKVCLQSQDRLYQQLLEAEGKLADLRRMDDDL